MKSKLTKILVECMREAGSIEELAERLIASGVSIPEANAECEIRNAEPGVAENLIGEIEAFASKHLLILKTIAILKPSVAAGGKHAFDLLLELLAELKKKYTEGDKAK
ncbi:MAG: hypothetical protein IJ303_04320 [Clostridia bacterium]|nr:hypothetical protein [Clostridia bacterium]